MKGEEKSISKQKKKILQKSKSGKKEKAKISEVNYFLSGLLFESVKLSVQSK